MDGEIRRKFECVRCGHVIGKRSTVGYSLNGDFPSAEFDRVVLAGGLFREKCSRCGGTMHPDESTTKRLAKYSQGIGRARVI